MGRPPRIDVGGEIYHVINRGNERNTIFHTDEDYAFFETLLFETLAETGVLCQAFVLMPNHWHLLLKTHTDGDLSLFMQLVTQSHARNVREKTRTIGNGHFYQARYKSFVVEKDSYFLTVLKYIERNPVRAGLVASAGEWRWGSAHHRINYTKLREQLNADIPIDLPADYRAWLSEPNSNEEREVLRLRSVSRDSATHVAQT